MAYYLAIKDKEKYRTLDITNLDKFDRLTKLKGTGASLEEIDVFTSKYQDEASLKKYLYENGVIYLDEITKEISIRSKYNGELKKVPYGLVYNGQKKYLNEFYLRSILLSRQNDYYFLERLAGRYRNSYVNNATVIALSDRAMRHYNYENDKILDAFLEREIYKYNSDTKATTLNYKGLHDLAMFVYSYTAYEAYMALGKSKNSLREERYEKLNNLKKSFEEENTKSTSKKLVKKKQIPGQMSLFNTIDEEE